MVTLRTYGELLAEYLRPQSARIAVLGVSLLINTGLRLTMPQVMRQFIDSALGGDSGQLPTLALLLIVVTVTQQGMMLAITYVGEWVGWKLLTNIKAKRTISVPLAAAISFDRVRDIFSTPRRRRIR